MQTVCCYKFSKSTENFKREKKRWKNRFKNLGTFIWLMLCKKDVSARFFSLSGKKKKKKNSGLKRIFRVKTENWKSTYLETSLEKVKKRKNRRKAWFHFRYPVVQLYRIGLSLFVHNSFLKWLHWKKKEVIQHSAILIYFFRLSFNFILTNKKWICLKNV